MYVCSDLPFRDRGEGEGTLNSRKKGVSNRRIYPIDRNKGF
jgi:hypothetical protein